MQLSQSMLVFVGGLLISGAAPSVATAAEPVAKAVTSEPALTGLATSTSPWATVAVFMLLAVAAVFVIYRRRSISPQGSALEIVSTRALGPRTKLVLLSVRGRELLLSVGDKGADLVSEWMSEETIDAAPLVEHTTITTGKITPLPKPSNDHNSDALSGIRALRKKTNFVKPVATWNQSLEDALQKELRR